MENFALGPDGNPANIEIYVSGRDSPPPAVNSNRQGQAPALKDNLFDATWAKVRSRLGYAWLFSLMVNVLQLTIPIFMMQIYDRVLVGRSFSTLWYLTLIAVFCLAASFVLDACRGMLLGRLGSWLEAVVANETFERAVNSVLRNEPYGAEATRDLVLVRGFLSGPAILILFDLPWVPLYMICVYLLHPTMGGIAISGGFLLFAMALLNEMSTRGNIAKSNEASRLASQRIATATRHPEAIDAMGMMSGIIRKWNEANERSLLTQSNAATVSSWLSSFSKFIRQAVQLGLICIGAALVLNQEMTGGIMIAASIIMGRALAPIEQAISAWRQVVGTRTAFRRLRDLFRKNGRDVSTMTMPRPEGRLVADNVTFGFPGTVKPLIYNVSLRADPGEAIALSGPSGLGKSCMARLLTGVWKPKAGVVTLDGADVATWNREDLGQYIGYLPQTVELHAGTIRENISRFHECSDEQVIAAAQIAGAHEMILGLPKGYDTDIGEAGTVLSGGQRQRVGLSRACFGSPSLVILDEPDSNLDRVGSEALVECISRLKQAGSTVVVIAHRNYLLSVVDRVYVFGNGGVSEVKMEEAQPVQFAVSEAQKTVADQQKGNK